MSRTITLFMWGYQPHFRIEVEHRAKDVLQSIAPTVQPRALLVGIRTPEKSDGHPVCVEPENEDWDPRIFFNCASRAEEIYTTHPDHEIIYGDEPSMRDKPENIRKKSVYGAVKEVTSQYDSQHGTTTFCGWPARLEGYHVMPILQFSNEQLSEYPHMLEPIRFQKWTLSTGLLQSTIECLLEEATNALGKKEPGRFFDLFDLDKASILRNAGKSFCAVITAVTGDIMLQEVYEDLNVISSLPYEGTEATGGILFAPVDAQAVETQVLLKKPVSLHDHKLVRKLIEMNSQHLLCVCRSAAGISGLGVLRDKFAEGIFQVSFTGHYKWDLYYKNEIIIKASFGIPQLPAVRLKKEIFSSNARRIIPNIQEDEVERLWHIVEAGMEQQHGTMIVLSEIAAEEAKRLKKQSLEIEPIELTPDLVRRFSEIDGAIMIDRRGICYAIGVILDGIASDEGDPSRGARYNSAIRYITSARSPTICLVVSEDGNVEVLPHLQPQVRRTEIERQISLLKTQNIENYHTTINWIDNHRFYITSEQCDTVNRELSRIRSVPSEVGEIRLEIPPFVPNPAMNESYYLAE